MKSFSVELTADVVEAAVQYVIHEQQFAKVIIRTAVDSEWTTLHVRSIGENDNMCALYDAVRMHYTEAE